VDARAEARAAGGGALDARVIAEWRALPLDAVMRRFRLVPGELRGHLTVVPEARWLKSAALQRFFAEQTIDHDADHEADLAVILLAVA